MNENIYEIYKICEETYFKIQKVVMTWIFWTKKLFVTGYNL